ncbi:Fad binding domain-containing protein [Neofusicoccum parvum]|nr:Fad binding domain-containing protein [Neofusicoccum parvum]
MGLLFLFFQVAFTLFLQRALASQQLLTSITDGCPQACAEISTLLGVSALHYPDNDPSFEIWDAKQQEVRPACRAEPSSTADVAAILEILTANWCTFAMKGGGHSRAVDASNSVGGVTIDMNKFNAADVAEDRATVRLGAGLTLGPAYTALEEYGLTFVGGRVDSVGIAGYTLGGGFSNLSPQYGLAVDNVFEYELVLPNATAVNVSETQHPDLYFALRGGVNNFGIVTHFTVRAVPQDEILVGAKVFALNYTDRVLDEAYKLTTAGSNDTYMAFWTRYAYNQSADSYDLSLSQAYSAPVLAPAVFAGVNSIPYESSDLRLDRMSAYVAASASAFGNRHLFTTLTYTPSAALDARILAIFDEELQSIKTATGFAPSVVTQPLHANAIKAMRLRGGNALGVESEADATLTVSLLTFGWKDAADDEAMYAFAGRWAERCRAAAGEMGLLNRYRYINYCKEDDDPFAGYEEAKAERLREVQKSVDPEGVFSAAGLCRGGFKLN